MKKRLVRIDWQKKPLVRNRIVRPVQRQKSLLGKSLLQVSRQENLFDYRNAVRYPRANVRSEAADRERLILPKTRFVSKPYLTRRKPAELKPHFQVAAANKTTEPQDYTPPMSQINIPSENGNLMLTKSTKLVGLKKKVEGTDMEAVESKVIPDLGGFEVVTLDPNENVDEALDRARAHDDVEVGTHVYFAEGDNRPVVATGVLYVEMAEGVGMDERQVIFDAFALDILEDREDGVVVCKVTANSPNPLKVSAALTKLSMIRKAYPDLDVPLDQYFVAPRDGLLGHQWHLQNDGRVADVPNFPLKVGADARVQGAWRKLGNLGSSNIIVAVIDNGFDLNHPDLRGKSVAPLSISSGGSTLPTGSRFGDHATPCASVAVAAANGSGLVGAAPLARLMPLHGLTFSKFLTERMFTHCIRNKADVISCSWGTIDPRYRPGAEHERSIRKALTSGRNGKGCVVVFAAGNEGREYINYYANIPGVIAVGASTSSDTHANYSNRGRGLSVVAPSDGGWPILAARASWDQGNAGMPVNKRYYVDGIDRGPYYKHFGGTSSATPLVAGICALILSANPNLTSVQVKQILESTADKIGNRWDYDSSGYSTKYGYGRVNAERAVTEALRLKGTGSTVTQPTQPTAPTTPTVPTPTPPVVTQPTTPTAPSTPTAPAPAPPSAPSVTGTNLFRFSVQGQARSGFGLQISVNNEFANVLKEVENLERKYQLPVLVNISSINGRTAFKILAGPYATRAAADSAKQKMVSMGAREPWLRPLNTL
ncbi:Serine protease, subtilisin family [Neolewinella agarilytica]|uniref:Serine protease, subtilisin family n=2 Tax=Neolewinella agarilytica TaxID=478744 RepID=A0A1H9NGE5_9BACT|nr:Serine protease, subtilisin family [Neolewinella agarilytica]